MVRVNVTEPHDVKSHLAIETCNLYQNPHFFPCIHVLNNLHSSHSQSPFIDWYLILRVGEDASIDTIRKQYHKLALMLHPDKNKHPKAEFAFKLISQAYKCLSDDARRCSFNLERWRNKCTECSRISDNTNSLLKSNPTNKTEKERNSPNSSKHSKSYKILHQFKVLKEQLKEEARVIENCIRINRVSNNEYPIFDPSSYANLGYPHKRHHHLHYKRSSRSGCMQKGVVPNFDQRRGRCESPIFELKQVVVL